MKRPDAAEALLVTATGVLLAGSLVSLAPAKKRHHHSIFGNVRDRGHHTVVAQSGDGAAATVRASPFELIPGADRFTLQIRGADGSYEGPVVAAGSGRQVVVGFREGARLGDIVRRNGFWVLRRPLDPRFQDRRRTARARNGAPIGAQSLGLVSAAATGGVGRGQDTDQDGIPNTFDVDVDGDRILNNVDIARPTTTSPDEPYRVAWLLSVGLKQSFLAQDMGIPNVAGFALNQNAKPPTMTTEQFESLRDIAGRIRGMLLFTLPHGDEVLELDCGGLSYCSGPGSTGRDITQFRPFPGAFDPDHDGFGTMEPTTLPLNPQRDGIGVTERLSPSAKVFVLKPTAAHFGDVAAGDTYIERVSRGGEEVSQQPVMLNYTFGTVPALAAWSDGSRQTTVTYPVPRGGEGTSESPYRSKQYPNGTLTFTVWRPQRRSFPAAGEQGDWIDVGRLLYSAAGFLEGPAGGDRVWTCPTSAYSTRDPNLVLESDGLRDLRSDNPLDPAQRLTFSVDIGACLRHSGIDPATVTASSAIYVTAASDRGDAAEGVGFSFAAPAPQQSQGSVGTWRFSTGSPGTQVDWTLQVPNYTGDHFGIKVYPPVSITGGTTPPGWSCSVRDLTSPSDMWFCTRFTSEPVSGASGSISLSQPGTDTMPVEAIAPKQPGQQGDIGYPLQHVP